MYGHQLGEFAFSSNGSERAIEFNNALSFSKNMAIIFKNSNRKHVPCFYRVIET